MPWVKIDDAFFTDGAVMAATAEARLLFIAGLCHASRNLTDGEIDKRALPSVAALAGVALGAADDLVTLGLWDDEGASYRAPRYLDYNPSAAKVQAERDAAKQRMSARRSGEVRANTERSSATPSRPVPSPTSSSSSSVPDEVWTTLARKKLATAKDVKNVPSWTRRVIANDRLELGTTAQELWDRYEISPSHLADVLASGGSSPSLNHLRKKVPA